MTDVTEAKINELKEAAKKGRDTPHGGAWREAMEKYNSLSRPNTILALLAERERLREALKPFAVAADHRTVWTWPDNAACLRAAFDWPDIDGNIRNSITVGDLRRARAAMGDNTDVR